MKIVAAVNLFFAILFGTLLLHATLSLGAADSKWGGEAEWRRTVDLGKKEGAAVVARSPDPVMRNEISPRFNARFGIPCSTPPAGRARSWLGAVRKEMPNFIRRTSS